MHHSNDPALVVLALPRGGVPVAAQVAEALNAPLDVFVVRKLGVPGYEELAMGAIASGGVRVLNEDIIERLRVPADALEAVTREEENELRRAELAFRDGREPLDVEGRNVVLVDDGLATGATMRAAVRALRLKRPALVVAAAPIGSKDTCDAFLSEVDELICGECPEPFFAVGTWYANFLPTTDEEVKRLLNHAAHQRRVRKVQEQRSLTNSHHE